MKYEEDVRFSHRNTEFLPATWDTMNSRQQRYTRPRAVLLRATQAQPHRKASRISIDGPLGLESTREPVGSFGGRWNVGAGAAEIAGGRQLLSSEFVFRYTVCRIMFRLAWSSKRVC